MIFSPFFVHINYDLDAGRGNDYDHATRVMHDQALFLRQLSIDTPYSNQSKMISKLNVHEICMQVIWCPIGRSSLIYQAQG